MKLWKWIKKCPMLFLLAAGWAGLAVYTWSEGKLTYALKNNIVENPVFTALLEPETDGLDWNTDDLSVYDHADAEDAMADWSGNGSGDKTSGTDGADHWQDKFHAIGGTERKTDKTDQTDGTGGLNDEEILSGKDTFDSNGTKDETGNPDGNDGGSVSTEPDDGTENADAADEKTAAGNDASGSKNHPVGVTRYQKYEKVPTDSQYYTDPGKKALTTDYDYQEVDPGYFDDALFIGDSRTVGMQDYSGLDNATFFAKTGLNVYEVLEDEFVEDPEDGSQVSISHMLQKYKYGKIYFMIGINELGTGNTGTFQKAYKRVIDKFHEWQPDAVIYMQGIIPVSRKKASSDAIFNNVNINDKNVAIAQLADGKDIFYLNVSTKLEDKDGFLRDDYTFDDVHMYAQYYGLWTEYLMKHAVVR